MKKTICTTLTFITLCGVAMLTQGCTENHDHGSAPAGTAGKDAHAHVHQSKYNEVLVEFPGHKYAMEIIDEKETTGLVTAFLTDAHFDPIAVDAKEVQLNFKVDGKPKTFTLTRTEQEAGKPATFTLTDMELATLLCEGWKGNATASVAIGGVPFSAKMVKLGEHDHAH